MLILLSVFLFQVKQNNQTATIKTVSATSQFACPLLCISINAYHYHLDSQRSTHHHIPAEVQRRRTTLAKSRRHCLRKTCLRGNMRGWWCFTEMTVFTVYMSSAVHMYLRCRNRAHIPHLARSLHLMGAFL